MSDGMYIAMNGAAARERQLESIADNLANAQTPGFKAQRPAFHSLLAATRDGSKPDKEQVHPLAVSTALDQREGLAQPTGRNLDVIPRGRGFMAVERENGERGYTRVGGLTVDGSHRLTSNGRPVLGTSGAPILVPPGAEPVVGEDGSVRVGATVVDRIALFELDGAIDRVAPGVLAPGAGGAAVPTAPGFRTGAVEQSNVNALETTIELISAQRHFESTMQALTTFRTIDQKANEIGRAR
jgi:flagellar basal-body rod protein FlgF